MALIPDLATAALYAVVVFLLFLGLLVVFVETIPPRLLMVIILAAILFAAGLAWVGEAGPLFLGRQTAAGLPANHGFERLTTRCTVSAQRGDRPGGWRVTEPRRASSA